jgi:pectin methylesterase-like acyl-CoA thioesterase
MMAAAVGAAAYFGTQAHAGTVDAYDPTGSYTDYLVDPTWTGAQGGTTATGADAGFAGVWSTVGGTTGALNTNGTAAMPGGASAVNPNRLFVDPGTYNVGTTFIKYNKNDVDVIGVDSVTKTNSDVVITSYLDSDYNAGSGTIGTSNSATLMLTGNNVAVANLTIANATDTPFIIAAGNHKAETPTGSYTGSTQTASAPAVALLSQGDLQAFSNVSILGYQDTLYLKGGRTYFTNSTISGDDDFIFANGTAVFNNDVINVDGNHSGGDVTAASTDKRTSNGFVFMNSTVTLNSVSGNALIDPSGDAVTQSTINGWTGTSNYIYSLGRPWGWQQAGGDAAVVYLNDSIQTKNLNSAGWSMWDTTETNASNGLNGGNPGEDSRFAVYNDTDLSSNSLNTTNFQSWSHTLSSAQAAMYTVANIFSFDSSTTFAGGWYGNGYPAGDNAPGSGLADVNPNYSMPAFWGPRNINNEEANDSITGNPAAYINPTWSQTSVLTWDPTIQLATVPEPGTISVLGGVGLLTLTRRRRKNPVTAS